MRLTMRYGKVIKLVRTARGKSPNDLANRRGQKRAKKNTLLISEQQAEN